MIFARIGKVASAAGLWMVVLLGAHSAVAVSFDDPTQNTAASVATFAAETLTGGGPSYAVDSSLLVGTGTFGTLTGVINKSEKVYFRLDVGACWGWLRRRAWRSAIPITKSPGQHVLRCEGADGDLHGGRQYRPERRQRLHADVQQRQCGGGAVGEGTVRMRAYDSIRDAVAGGGTDLLDKSVTLLNVARAITIKAVKQTQTATVASGFTQFEAAPTGGTVPIAGLNIGTVCTLDTEGDGLADADNNTCVFGTTVPSLASANVTVTGSKVKYSGDGGFAFGALMAQPGATSDAGVLDKCGGTGTAVTLPPGADGKPDPAGPGTAAVAQGAQYLCATVKATNATRIEAGDYMADVSFVTTDLARPFSPMGMEDLGVGTIKHDGTSVNVPFLTSYKGYVQRLIIVNRNKQGVSYTLTFHTEGSGTADPGMLEGMAKGGMATVIKVADEVTFTSPTRGSGMLDIVSTPGMVDVATTMVNVADQSTDTVSSTWASATRTTGDASSAAGHRAAPTARFDEGAASPLLAPWLARV